MSNAIFTINKTVTKEKGVLSVIKVGKVSFTVNSLFDEDESLSDILLSIAQDRLDKSALNGHILHDATSKTVYNGIGS